MTTPPFPCVCCGFLTFEDPPGSDFTCDVCGWEDDPVQMRWPLYEGGANKYSLVQCQAFYATWGTTWLDRVGTRQFAKFGFAREPGFRPIDLARDVFELVAEKGLDWPEDRTVLYWWRPTFWLADRRIGDRPE